MYVNGLRVPRVACSQGAFEGQKAYRTADGRILLFRPDENAQRLQRSAERMCMLAPSQEEFIAGVEACVRANLRWVRELLRHILTISYRSE